MNKLQLHRILRTIPVSSVSGIASDGDSELGAIIDTLEDLLGWLKDLLQAGKEAVQHQAEKYEKKIKAMKKINGIGAAQAR